MPKLNMLIYVLITIKKPKKGIHQKTHEFLNVFMENNVEMDYIVNTIIDLKSYVCLGQIYSMKKKHKSVWI